MRLIYVPRGRAAEYAPLSISGPYVCCGHGCIYCFNLEIRGMCADEFSKSAKPKPDFLKKFEKDCAELAAAKDQREILISFSTDPYQPLDYELQLTRKAIEILIRHGLHFTILTKAGGPRSTRDFDLMAEHPELCRYGTTLVFDNLKDKGIWEPGAAHTPERIEALREAKKRGIRTWVSFEPVVFPDQTINLIRQTLGFVDEYRIGKFNHANIPDVEEVIRKTGYRYPTDDEWRIFVQRAEALLRHHNQKFIFKKDLQPYLQAAGVTC